MIGAEVLVRSLLAHGVNVCFTNPGTSEMHLVHALDRVPEMRAVLALFEGVATGAADGYGRMTGRPASTLLHLGPGLANGLANLHNAQKARTPIVNIVGEHATYHRHYDAPLTSDLEGIARPVSAWLRTADSAESLAALTAEAVAAAGGGDRPGAIATLAVSADAAWTETDVPPAAHAAKHAAAPAPAPETVTAAAKALAKAEKPVLLMGGSALLEPGLDLAGRLAAATGAKLFHETFVARRQKGAGRVPVTRLPYFGEMALDALQGADLMVLIGAQAPVAFFAYPGKPSLLVPEGCEVLELVGRDSDALTALEALAAEVGVPPDPQSRARKASDSAMPEGALTVEAVAVILSALMPEGAVVVDEAVSSGLAMDASMQGAPPHDWLYLTGGSIGDGLPLALGAALASPDRKTICLEGDGSAMYTLQALWTMARERLDVTTVIFANRSYAILDFEFDRVGAGRPGARAQSMMDLAHPELGWQDLARGLGVHAMRAQTAEDFARAFRIAMQEAGPHLIEAVVPGPYSSAPPPNAARDAASRSVRTRPS